MGLLKLLTFPVSGPVLGGKWVLQTLLDEAERQYYDEAAIRQQMAALESDFQAGRLSDAEFDAREEALLERLLEARRYHQRKQDAAADRAAE
jgi:hypothetical protein